MLIVTISVALRASSADTYKTAVRRRLRASRGKSKRRAIEPLNAREERTHRARPRALSAHAVAQLQRNPLMPRSCTIIPTDFRLARLWLTRFRSTGGLEMATIGRSWVGEAVTAAALVLLFVTILARLGG
jgi:hypothetical protein